MLLLVLIGCTKIEKINVNSTSGDNTFKTDVKINDVEETKKLVDYEVYEKLLTITDNGGESFDIPYFQVQNMDDITLENKINEILKNSIKSWVTEECRWFEAFQPEVKLKSSEYLSICYTAEWENPNGDGFENTVSRVCVTVDIREGKRVYLNDFFDSDSTIRKVLEKYSYDSEFATPIDLEEADRIIDEASMSVEDYFYNISNSDPLVYDFMKSYISKKSSFYLQENKLVITRNENERDDIFLDY